MKLVKPEVQTQFPRRNFAVPMSLTTLERSSMQQSKAQLFQQQKVLEPNIFSSIKFCTFAFLFCLLSFIFFFLTRLANYGFLWKDGHFKSLISNDRFLI